MASRETTAVSVRLSLPLGLLIIISLTSPCARTALLNITGTIPGPLNAQFYVPFTAPNTSAVSVGGGGVFVSPLLNKNFTAASAPKPVNLTASGLPNPWSTDPGFNYANGTEVIQAPTATSTKPASGKNAGVRVALGAREGAVVTVLVGFVLGVIMVV